MSHDILLAKLGRYGIRGITNTWIRNYLTGRLQYVSFDQHVSPTLSVTCGVPQGSILGPLLFLLYINDISSVLDKSQILSFADDTTIYLSHHDESILYQQANIELEHLYEWLCANKLALNTEKNKYIIIRPPQRSLNNDLPLNINGLPLARIGKHCKEQSLKFLGVNIDEHLTWQYHIKYINNKISRALFMLNKVKNFLPKRCMRTLYYGLVHPSLIYGLLAWGHTVENSNNKMFLLQKRALRIINRERYNTHTDPLFKSNRILKVSDLYKQQTNIFMMSFNKHILPVSFDGMFKYNHEIHPERITRNMNHIHIERSKNKFVGKLPKFSYPRLFNETIDDIQINRGIPTIKKHIKQQMLQNYLAQVNCNNVYCRQCNPVQ